MPEAATEVPGFRHEHRELAGARAEFEALRAILPVVPRGRADTMIARLWELVAELGGGDWSESPLPAEDEGPLPHETTILIIEMLRCIATYDGVERDVREIRRRAENRFTAATERGARRDSLELMSLHERILEARFPVAEERDAAIDAMRVAIEHRRAVSGRERDFGITLREVSLAGALRDRARDGDLEEARAIAQANRAWRSKAYGPEHAFTLVAISHELQVTLATTEPGSWSVRPGAMPAALERDVPALRGALAQAEELVRIRGSLLGERAASMVTANAILSRVRLQLLDYDGAKQSAEAALAVAETTSSSDARNHVAIARVVLACCLAREGRPGDIERGFALLDTASPLLNRSAAVRVWRDRADHVWGLLDRPSQ